MFHFNGDCCQIHYYQPNHRQSWNENWKSKAIFVMNENCQSSFIAIIRKRNANDESNGVFWMCVFVTACLSAFDTGTSKFDQPQFNQSQVIKTYFVYIHILIGNSKETRNGNWVSITQKADIILYYCIVRSSTSSTLKRTANIRDNRFYSSFFFVRSRKTYRACHKILLFII